MIKEVLEFLGLKPEEANTDNQPISDTEATVAEADPKPASAEAAQSEKSEPVRPNVQREDNDTSYEDTIELAQSDISEEIESADLPDTSLDFFDLDMFD